MLQNFTFFVFAKLKQGSVAFSYNSSNLFFLPFSSFPHFTWNYNWVNYLPTSCIHIRDSFNLLKLCKGLQLTCFGFKCLTLVCFPTRLVFLFSSGSWCVGAHTGDVFYLRNLNLFWRSEFEECDREWNDEWLFLCVEMLHHCYCFLTLHTFDFTHKNEGEDGNHFSSSASLESSVTRSLITFSPQSPESVTCWRSRLRLS